MNKNCDVMNEQELINLCQYGGVLAQVPNGLGSWFVAGRCTENDRCPPPAPPSALSVPPLSPAAGMDDVFAQPYLRPPGIPRPTPSASG